MLPSFVAVRCVSDASAQDHQVIAMIVHDHVATHPSLRSKIKHIYLYFDVFFIWIIEHWTTN